MLSNFYKKGAEGQVKRRILFGTSIILNRLDVYSNNIKKRLVNKK